MECKTRFTCQLVYISGLLLSSTLTHASSYTFKVLNVPSALINSQNPATNTFATGINNQGQVVGYVENAGNSPGFIHNGGEYKPLVQTSGQAIQSVYGINDIGQITGSCHYDSPLTGVYQCLYNYTTHATKDTNEEGALYGINNVTQFVGKINEDNQITHGVIFTEPYPETVDRFRQSFSIDVPDFAKTSTVAYGINDNGVITGTFQNQWGIKANHGYIYDGKSYTQLDVPKAVETFAFDINNIGQIVGAFSNETGIHGYVFDGKNYDTVDAPGANETRVLGINDHGQLTGFFTDVKGTHGFIAEPDDFSSRETALCKANASFNIWTKILSLKDVDLAGKRYAGKMQMREDMVNTFQVSDVSETAVSNCKLTDIPRFNTNNVLLIPKVSAYGTNYQILMQSSYVTIFELVDALKI